MNALVIMNMKILIGHHRSTLVPLATADDMNMANAKCIGASDDCPHIKVPPYIFDGNLKSMVFTVEVGNNGLNGLTFIVVDDVPAVFIH